MSNIYILSLYYHSILSSWLPSEFKSRRHRSDGTQPGPGAKPQQKREEHFGSLVQALMFSVPGVFKPLTLAFPWEFLITLKNIELITILDYKVVPQFVSASVGLYNSNFTMVYGRYIELLTLVYNPTFTSLGGHHLVDLMKNWMIGNNSD